MILTGMGDDGVLGAQAILSGGGTVLAESELTAVVYGMPGSAVRAGAVTHVLPLPRNRPVIWRVCEVLRASAAARSGGRECRGPGPC